MVVSLKDIAKRAGVSVATVSNVVNGYRPVGEATRKLVQQAIDDLGYSPNLSARHLRNGRTGIIALASARPDSTGTPSCWTPPTVNGRRSCWSARDSGPRSSTG